MRPLRALAIYIVVVFIGGCSGRAMALLVSAVFGHAFPEAFGGFFTKLAQNPFHRFVNRSLLGLALLGMWPLLKSLGTTSLREAGLKSPVGEWKRLCSGFGVGFISLALVAGLALACGARHFSGSITWGQLGRRWQE